MNDDWLVEADRKFRCIAIIKINCLDRCVRSKANGSEYCWQHLRWGAIHTIQPAFEGPRD